MPALAGLCGWLASSCAPEGGRDDAKPELLFFCGAGLRAPVAEAVAAFEKENAVTIATDYAGSEHLLGKIKPSRTGDLFLPGDSGYVDLLAGSGLVKSRRTVCWFAPAILVAKGNPKGIRSLEDLMRPELKVGVGDENACAIGPVTREIFRKNGFDWGEATKRFAYASPTVNALGEHIVVGSLDAAIVWDGVAMGYAEKADVVLHPPGAECDFDRGYRGADQRQTSRDGGDIRRVPEFGIGPVHFPCARVFG